MARRNRSTPTRNPLSPRRIAAEAIALADDEGLEALSMRKLAQRLGVEAMSLYHHLPSKASLLEAMAEELMGTLPEIPLRSGDWSECLLAAARAWRSLATAHPGAFPLLATRSQATPTLFKRLGGLLIVMAEAGFAPVARARAISSFFTALNGYLLAAGVPAFFRDVPEQALEKLPEMDPGVAEAFAEIPANAWSLSSDEAYEAHARVVIAGLAGLLPRSRRSPRQKP